MDHKNHEIQDWIFYKQETVHIRKSEPYRKRNPRLNLNLKKNIKKPFICLVRETKSRSRGQPEKKRWRRTKLTRGREGVGSPFVFFFFFPIAARPHNVAQPVGLPAARKSGNLNKSRVSLRAQTRISFRTQEKEAISEPRDSLLTYGAGARETPSRGDRRRRPWGRACGDSRPLIEGGGSLWGRARLVPTSRLQQVSSFAASAEI